MVIRLKRRTLKREENKVKMLGHQYERLWQAWSENAMLFHDMENHLQAIYHLAEAAGNQEICQYISNISKPMERLTGILWTNIGIVDAVLNAKKQLAEEKGYQMDINAQLPANTGIREDDFCTILTNLLDNAIESMDREKDDIVKAQPIEVSLRHIHHFLVIRVSNPCSGEYLEKHGFFPTAKKNRFLHGWGLKNVRRTVQKYDGSLALEVEEGRFVALAMLFFVS